MGVVLIGGPECTAKMRTLQAKVNSGIIKSCLNAGAEVGVELAKDAVEEKSGRTKESIKVLKSTPKTAEYGPDWFVGNILEKGTGARQQKKSKRYTGVMPAKPFLAPTHDAPEVQAAVNEEFIKQMKTVGAL